MILQDTPTVCELCQKTYLGDGYQWVCDDCLHPSDCPSCKSDDVRLQWHIVNDQNGELCPVPMWCVECYECEITTPYFETAQEAYDSWMHGKIESGLYTTESPTNER